MLISSSGRLQCLAVFLLFTLLTTCAQGYSDTFSSISPGSSMGSVTPPYSNTTSITPASSPTLGSSNSLTTPTDMATSSSPANTGSSMSIISSTGILPSTDSVGSLAIPTDAYTSSSTGSGSSGATTSAPDASTPTTSTIFTLTSSVTNTAVAVSGNGTRLSASFTSSSVSVPIYGMTNTGTSSGDGTSSSSSPTSLVNENSSTMIRAPSRISPSTRNKTSTPSSSTGGSASTPDTEIGTFKYLGCAASSSGFAGFTLVDNSTNMSLDKCVSDCGTRLYTYAGIYIAQCYCATTLTSDITVIPGRGSCNIPCPGNPTESCGGVALANKQALKRRQLQAGTLLSLFANIAAVFSSSNLQPTLSTSTINIPNTAFPSESGSNNSSALIGSTNPVPTAITKGGVNAPFDNGTSSSSTGLPTSLTTTNFITVPSAFFGNRSSTISQLSSPTSLGSPISPTVSPGVSNFSQSTGSQRLATTTSSGTTEPIVATNFFSNSDNFIGFTITEIVYTTTSFCPATITTVVSGMPAIIVTNFVSTIILTSTVIVPCHKCIEPSQMITLPPTITSSGLYQSPASEPSDIIEVIVTEIIYTTVSTCPVTIDTSIFYDYTSYYVTNTVSTLTRTATTTVPCQNCRPRYATVTVMLLGGLLNGSTGNGAGLSGPGSLSTVPSNQSPPTGADEASCPGCDIPLNEDVRIETTRIAIIIASSPVGPPPAAQSNAQGSIYGGGQVTVPVDVQSNVPNGGQSTIPASGPNSIPAVRQSIVPGGGQSTIPAGGQSTVVGGGQSTVQASSSMEPTSAPNHGPYLTNTSERSMKIFSQTMAIGLVLTVGAGLAML